MNAPTITDLWDSLIASDTATPYSWAVLASAPLTTNGTYSIFVYDHQGDDFANYGLCLQRTFEPGNAVAMLYGDCVLDTIDSLVELDAYTFAGSAGDVVEIRAWDDAWQSSSYMEITLQLYDPGGQLIASDTAAYYDSARIGPVTLPDTDTYAIFVYDFQGDDFAEYWMKLWSPQLCTGCCGIRDNVCDPTGFEEKINVADLTCLVDYLFRGDPPPLCFQEADVNGDGKIHVADVTYLVDYLFRGGPPPPLCP